MKISDIGNQPCSIARTLSVIGDTWSIMIIRNAFLGIRRFEDFQKNLGITRHVLTDRLNTLIEEQILYKAPYTESQKRFEYRLTPKGLDLYPVLLSLVKWGDQYMDQGLGAPLDFIHQSCGHRFEAVMVCSACKLPLNPKQVTVKMGQGFRLAQGLENSEQKQSELKQA